MVEADDGGVGFSFRSLPFLSTADPWLPFSSAHSLSSFPVALFHSLSLVFLHRSPDLFLIPWVSFSVFLSLSSPFPARYFFLSFALRPLLKFSQSFRSFSRQPESSLLLLGLSLAVSPLPSLAITFSAFIWAAPSRNLTSKAQKKLNSLAPFFYILGSS